MKSKYIISTLIMIGVILLFLSKIHATTSSTIKQDNTSLAISNLNQKPTVITNVDISSKNLINSAPIRVGAVTWHTKNFVNKEVKIVGFVLKKEKNYILFSDEATGAVTVGDLPVTGSGVDAMILKHKYILQGKFLYHGLRASNGNLYHLELSELPLIAY